MTPKMEAFVREYLVDLNASAAARRAGYSARVSGQIAGKLMQRHEIQEAIQKAADERAERTGINADYVLACLQKIVGRCMADETWDAAQANRSLELLGKHLKMWTDKVENKTEGSMEMRFVWDDGDSDSV